MTAITIPWYFLIFYTYLDTSAFQLSPITIILVFLWTASVVASRVYNGHHSPLDVIVGAVLGVVILVVFTFQLRVMVDAVFLNNSVAGILTVFGTLISILALHPTPPKVPTPAYPETGLVTGTCAGAILALWTRVTHDPQSFYLAYHSLFHMDQPYPPQFPFLSNHLVLVYLLRFVVGVILVMITRLVVKKTGTWLVLQIAHVLNIKKYDTKTGFKFSEAETAVKFLTYCAVGFTTTFTSHVAFVFLGLHLPLDDVILAATKFHYP